MSSSRRTAGSKSKPQESNENEPPRSPLNPIQDPQPHDHLLKIDGSAPRSPRPPPAKAISRVVAGNSGSGGNSAREKSSNSHRILKGLHDAKSFMAAAATAASEVPCFELDEDPSFWEDRNVQVLIRVRPINGMESAVHGYNRCLIQESSQTLRWIGHPETRFTFDHVASEITSQEKLFRVVGSPMVENCMSGYNSCMFAYGQTGSGKTYTMMGEIHEMDKNLSDDRGMTPRIFEYLFARIKEEEERRYGEQLKYSCKCSFLEIYNEQITDLLEPSSNNLQLREDIKKGVYCENLKEYEVSSVKDVMDLLLQGTANRKIAATNMNSESSRSHSVFTCVIESRWENDSMTHLRFGRLNLVDLAGSERQKSSGAEGERLKEAANINRSLSTLGLVIMTLVDITNGKNRHVPYRDSRLTFLLQDSLGGNSKTTIVANISPSICSAGETLSTLKFAQRAKLIQNNAKVNEDASGDVMVLQRQIQKLKDQLTVLIKHQSVPTSLCYSSTGHDQATLCDLFDDSNSLLGDKHAALNDTNFLHSEIKQLEAALTSALRREEMAVSAVRKLEAEIKHMNRLVHQREVDAQRAKTLLKFREEKLRRLELLADDLVSSDGFIMEENVALSQEIELLRERIDMNPDLTQFALENMRLLEQLRMFQNFYKHGERDTLLAEVSHLRNQLLKVIEGKFALVNAETTQGPDDIMELDSCRRQLDACLENNAQLTREVDDLQCQLKHNLDSGQSPVLMDGDLSAHSYTIEDLPKDSVVELSPVKEDIGDGIISLEHANRVPETKSYQDIGDIEMRFSTVQEELTDAKLLIKSMEAQQACLVSEIDDLKQERERYLKPSRCTSIGALFMDHPDVCHHIGGHGNVEQTEHNENAGLSLHAAMERIDTDIEETKFLNMKLQDDDASKVTCHHEMEHVHDQAEADTAKTILCLQELDPLRQEFDSNNGSHIPSIENSLLLRRTSEELDNRQSFLIKENAKLSSLVAVRDAEISAISYEWEKATIDLITFLVDGRKSLDDASQHIESVVESFPRWNECINKYVESAMKVYIEKETLIADLQKSLEEAQQMGLEMKSKLNSLRGATLAITEIQQQENYKNSKELYHLKKLLDEKVCMIQRLESLLKCRNKHITETEKISSSTFEVIKQLHHMDLEDSTDVVKFKFMIKDILNEISKENIEQVMHQSSATREQIMSCNPAIDKCTSIEMCETLQTLEERMDKIDIDCSQTREIMHLNLSHAHLEAEEINKHTPDFLKKFEVAQEIMEEAEVVLNALLKANEGVKHEKDWWKQVSAELLAEKDELIKDVQHLEASKISKENQYRNLQDQIQASLIEMFAIISSLGESLQQIKRTTREELNAICLDISSIKKELLHIIGITRSRLEDLMSEIFEGSFASFVLYECHRGALAEQIMLLDTYSDSLPSKCAKSCSLLQDEYTEGDMTVLRNEDIRVLEGMQDQDIVQSDMNSNFSSLGSTREGVNTFDMVQYTVGDPIVGSHICKYERRELSFNNRCPPEGVSRLEKDNTSITNHIGLVEDMIEKWSINCSHESCSIKQADTESNVFILKNELSRKDALINGLLFDLRLLQESTSSDMYMKDEFKKMGDALNEMRHELTAKTNQIETILVEQNVLENHLSECEAARASTMYQMEQTQKELNMLSDENTKLRLLLEDVYTKKTQFEKLLEEKEKVIEGLQKEILYINSSVEGQMTSSVEEILDELRVVCNDRDHLQAETAYLNNKIEMFSSLVDENEAIAVEARQAAEACKIYAEEKEAEVKVLEHSIEELEGTINIMEMKVYDMKEEVEHHQSIRRGLELEVQALTKRMLSVENAAVNLITEYSNVGGENCHIPRRLDDQIIELCEARKYIEDLEMEKSYTTEEIKHYREHISELVLHSEAQSSIYEEKFKTLEAIVSEVKPDSASSNLAFTVADKIERIPIRTRGSGSPFRCISSLVQQMNLEKDQELHVARQQIEELQALASDRQKEICMLTARLAAADSMTHDVIRDLLGVKLDMTNYANLIDQEEVQKLLEKAHQQSEEKDSKEGDVLNLKKQIDHLITERESLVEEIKERKEEILASQFRAEQLLRKLQLLTAQNEMLKMDKTNLYERIAELDEKVKFSFGSQNINAHQLHLMNIKENSSSRPGNEEFSKRLAQSDKLLSHMRHR